MVDLQGISVPSCGFLKIPLEKILPSPDLKILSKISPKTIELHEVNVKEDKEQEFEFVSLENEFLKVKICKKTGKFSVFDKEEKRVAIDNGNEFLIFEDIPLYWDAWFVKIFNFSCSNFIIFLIYFSIQGCLLFVISQNFLVMF